MRSLAREDQETCHKEIEGLQVCVCVCVCVWKRRWRCGYLLPQGAILQALVPRDAADKSSAILEARAGKSGHARTRTRTRVWGGTIAGAGGKEASLFTAQVFQMYQKFSAFKQWNFEVLEIDTSDGGGFKVLSLVCLSAVTTSSFSVGVSIACQWECEWCGCVWDHETRERGAQSPAHSCD